MSVWGGVTGPTKWKSLRLEGAEGSWRLIRGELTDSFYQRKVRNSVRAGPT